MQAKGEEAEETTRTRQRRSRRRELPSVEESRPTVPRRDSGVPRPDGFTEPLPVPDRWRVVDTLGQTENRFDPYNQNTLKGDKPVRGDDGFFSVTATSDLVMEARAAPLPVGVQTTSNPGALDVLGNPDQDFLSENVAAEFVYYKGDTVFRPPDYEFRFTPVVNYNRTQLNETLGINADPGRGLTRNDGHVGVQAAFFDKHLRDVSPQYDFDSFRIGIQPFSSDFRGFLYQDSPFGLRLFGTRDNNRMQYNLAWFRRLEKDTNSGLNDLGATPRKDDLFIANVYWQDRPALGFFSQFTIIYNRNRDTDTFYDQNGFIARPASVGEERPKQYDVVYLGYNGDGHLGRLNLTTSFYVALGEERSGVFSAVHSDIEAWFFAAEPSFDFDWMRVRLSLLLASGDDSPFDETSQGFDAIFENPQFAGADASYWVRQSVPLIGGGRVALSTRNGLLNTLRSSKEHGQSNFVNPGLVLFGGGVDLDLLPSLRLSLNANGLAFADTAVVEAARSQANIDDKIGVDLSASLVWRPFMSQNVVARLSYATLRPGDGFQQMFGTDSPYSVLGNIVFTY